jgi:hypothetical protein
MTPGIRTYRRWLFAWGGRIEDRLRDKRHAALLAAHLSPPMLGRHAIRFQAGRALDIQHRKNSLKKLFCISSRQIEGGCAWPAVGGFEIEFPKTNERAVRTPS